VAATEKTEQADGNTSTPSPLSALMSAALALPILAIPTKATALENAAIGYRILEYREGDGRMKVREPLLWAKGSLGQFDFAASGMVDLVSGASPQFVSNERGTPIHTLSGASIRDRRNAAEVKVAHRFEGWSLGVSRNVSFENDYTSRALGVEVKADFAEKNTTLQASFGRNNDEISSFDDATLHERRRTREFLVGVTQVIDARSIVQSNLQFTRGKGYFNDPYRFTTTFFPDTPPITVLDTRPGERKQTAWLTRYRRTLSDIQGVLALDYRYYTDDWGIRSHTFGAAYTRTIAEGWKITPGLRYYSQTQADFYRTLLPQSLRGTRDVPSSSDQRLAAFGGLQPSITVTHTLANGATIDLMVSSYRQRASWKLGGDGSDPLATFSARSVMAGITWPFGN
jgi:hypothetical protein